MMTRRLAHANATKCVRQKKRNIPGQMHWRTRVPVRVNRELSTVGSAASTAKLAATFALIGELRLGATIQCH